MLMSVLKPEITGKHNDKRKKQPTKNQKNTKILFLHLTCQGAIRPLCPINYCTVLNLSFPKISTTTNFDLKTEFGHETR